MGIGQISTEKKTPALGWARRLLTRQLDALRRLAATAGRFAGSATRLAADPFVGALAVERAVKAHVKAAWVTRLIEALRLKLTGDLQRLDRGEAAPPQPKPRPAAPPKPAQPPAPPPALSLAQIVAADLEDLEARVAAMRRGELSDWLDEEEDLDDEEDFEFERESPERESFGLGSRPDEFAEILKLPTDEIIAFIARELGLPPDWLEQEEAWEQEVALSQRGRWIEAQPRDGGGAPEHSPLDAEARPPPPF